MDFSKKKCVPCEGGVDPIGESSAKKMLKDIPGWQIVNAKLKREFKFKNFIESLNFTNKVGIIAEKEQHHPDIELGWGYCNVTIFTHAIGGISENDIILAAKINEIFGNS